MIIGLDHVGYISTDRLGANDIMEQLGLVRVHSGTAAAYGVNCDFWAAAGQATATTSIEIVSAARPASSIDESLARSGNGLHHLAFEVDDLEGELERLRRRGCVRIDANPCAGAKPGMTVAFMYVSGPARLLIELVEYQEPGD